MDGARIFDQHPHSNTVNALMPRRIKSVCRSVESCLLLSDLDAWIGLSTVLRARLSKGERSALAYVSLRALPSHEAQLVGKTALEAYSPPAAGQPIAPLFKYMEEAAFWADLAAPGEHEAYCFACFKAMPKSRQNAFLDYVMGGRQLNA